jgi:hypothetical protein
MKKTTTFSAFALLACLIMLISSCSKEITVDYVIADKEKCLVASSFTGTVVDTFIIKQEDIKAAFAAAKATFDTKKIKSMVAKGFKVKGSGSSNLDGITGAELRIKALGTSGTGEQIASSSTKPATGATEIELAINGTDLKNLLGGPDLVVTLSVYYDNVAAKCVTVTKGTMTFNVKN